MRIKVIDAFGTEVGAADVQFAAATQHDGTTIAEEAKLIFEPHLTVVLPTKDPRAPWRFEVEV